MRTAMCMFERYSLRRRTCCLGSAYVCDPREGRSVVEPDSHLGRGVACTAGCRPTQASESKTSEISKISKCGADVVKFGEILLRPMERTVASGSEGDGAGLNSVPA